MKHYDYALGVRDEHGGTEDNLTRLPDYHILFCPFHKRGLNGDEDNERSCSLRGSRDANGKGWGFDACNLVGDDCSNYKSCAMWNKVMYADTDDKEPEPEAEEEQEIKDIKEVQHLRGIEIHYHPELLPIKPNTEINQDNVIPNGTILIKCGEKYKVENFRAEYILKEIEQNFGDRRFGDRRFHVGTDTIKQFKIFEEGKENRTHEELEGSIESLEHELKKTNNYMDKDFKEIRKLKEQLMLALTEKTRLQSENDKLTDQIHTGFGGNS